MNYIIFFFEIIFKIQILRLFTKELNTIKKNKDEKIIRQVNIDRRKPAVSIQLIFIENRYIYFLIAILILKIMCTIKAPTNDFHRNWPLCIHP
jgi:hypothetical protein